MDVGTFLTKQKLSVFGSLKWYKMATESLTGPHESGKFEETTSEPKI